MLILANKRSTIIEYYSFKNLCKTYQRLRIFFQVRQIKLKKNKYPSGIIRSQFNQVQHIAINVLNLFSSYLCEFP